MLFARVGWETGSTPRARPASLQWCPGRDQDLPPGLPQPDSFPGIQTEVSLTFPCCICVQAYLSMNENADKRREAFLCMVPAKEDPDCPILQKDRF